MSKNTLFIALADDNEDDRLRFKKAMENLKINTELSILTMGKS